MKKLSIAMLMALSPAVIACQSQQQTDTAAALEPTPFTYTPSTYPVPRVTDKGHVVPWWQRRVEKLNKRAAAGGDVIFVGDSITHFWDGEAGRDIWEANFTPWNPVNLGISADRTEHVLWRLQNGALNMPHAPKAMVLMIGTNNTGQRNDSPEAIRDGIAAIIDTFQEEFPESDIILLAIFPKGQNSEDAGRINNIAANALIETLAQADERIHFYDIGDIFLDEDGVLSKDIMPDFLHPGPAGYELWAEAMVPILETHVPLKNE